MNLDEIQARANAATPGPWAVYEKPDPWGYWAVQDADGKDVFDDGSAGAEYGQTCSIADRDFLVAARTDVPALVARVRELEAERDAYARSHAILKAIHGALTDALPNTPIPALDSFDVVEMVRGLAQEKARAVNIGPVLWENEQLRSHARAVSNLLAIIHGDGGHYEGKHGTVKACKDAEGVVPDLRLKLDAAAERVRELEEERDQALADYQDLGRVMHEECARLEAECERLKTFAAQNFSAMIRQEAEQMREYGLSYEGVRKVLHEYNDGEISFGKLMDLIRAAARAMAEDMKK